MQKIRIIALQSEKYHVIKTLHKENVIDIRKSTISLRDDNPIGNLPVLSEILVRYRSAEAALEKSLKDFEHLKETEISHLEVEKLIEKAKSLKAVNEVFELSEKRDDIGGELGEMDNARKTAQLFVGTDVDFSKLQSETLNFVAFHVPEATTRNFDRALNRVRGESVIIKNKIREGEVVFIAYPKRHADYLDQLTKVQRLSEIELSSRYLNDTPEKVIEQLEKEERALREELASINSRLAKLANDNISEVAAIREMLEVEVERSSVSINFKRTEATFAVEGWIPRAKLEQFEREINGATKGRVMFEKIETDELAPTLTNRPQFLRPFDYMVEFLSIPRSDEIDPTWIFIVSFPVFYGLMVSDAGYGIFSLIFAYWLTRISDPEGLLYNTAKIWELSAVSAVFFGVLSNQYLGFGLNQYIFGSNIKFFTFDWLANTTTILLLTVYFGLFQVLLGLLFSFINNIRHGHTKHAMSKVTSIILIVSGFFAVGGFLFHAYSSDVTNAATIIAIISAIMTIALSGLEATELTSLIAHPLSYARILGFGISSVIIAQLIDKAFTPSLSGGILSFVLLLIVFIVLHFVNMLLGIFEGAVQAIRLNFVEFFSKFYTGGGSKYTPFYYKRRYTKEKSD